MKQFVSIAGALGALALVLTAGGASAADRSINVGAADMRMQVLDLTPADGIAAGYTVNGFNSTLRGTFYWDMDDTLTVPGGRADALSMTLHNRTINASVGADPGDMTLSYTVPSVQLPGAESYTSGKQVISLTLAPHSLLLIDGTAFSGASNWQGWAMDSGIDFRLAGAATDPVSAFGIRGYTGTNYLLERDLHLAYANVTGQDMSLTLTISSFMSVAAVPEPTSALMLAAGIAVIGFASRRRKHA